MGDLQDMSGTNDAFNSSICSLEVSLFSSVPDPHHFVKLDPDPHQSKKQGPDPHES
jgi:hypothetical protein